MEENKFFVKAVEKFKTQKGRGYVAFEKRDKNLFFRGDGYVEEVLDYDISIETERGKVNNVKEGDFCFIIKSERKFAMQIGMQYFSCGYDTKNVSELQSLLVYVKTASMVMLLYFDVEKGILPFLNIDMEIEDMKVDPMLGKKFSENRVDSVTNVYNLIHRLQVKSNEKKHEMSRTVL